MTVNHVIILFGVIAVYLLLAHTQELKWLLAKMSWKRTTNDGVLFPIIIVVVLGIFLSSHFYQQYQQSGGSGAREAINLVKNKQVHVSGFGDNPIQRTVESYISDYDPQASSLHTGGLAYNSPPVDWKASSITKSIYLVTATNTRLGSSYEFEVNLITGEIKSRNENASTLQARCVYGL